jgi:serine protease Do
MNTAIITGGGGFGGEAGNIGIGFAVPVNLAKSVMDQIMKTGKVSRGYMGVTLQNLTPDLAQQFGLKDTHGAIVGTVTPGAPGARAGLQSGDVITAIDGNKVEDSNELTMQVISHSPGSTVALQVFRNGQPMTVHVTLGQRPTAVDWDQRGHQNDSNGESPDTGSNGNATIRGITVENLTPELAQQAQVPSSTHGVVIDDVDQATPAAGAIGIGRGSVITAVDRHPVNNVQDFQRLMNQAQGKAVLLTVQNGDQVGFTVIPAK